MEQKQLLTKKFILVNMNHADISTDEKPIIGTDSLSSCTGLLLYSHSQKKAIVAHLSRNWHETIVNVFNLAMENNLLSEPLKYFILPGGYLENSESKDVPVEQIEQTLKDHFICSKFDSIKSSDIRVVQLGSDTQRYYGFAFDSSTGEFVTDKVLFGSDYYEVNNEKRY